MNSYAHWQNRKTNFDVPVVVEITTLESACLKMMGFGATAVVHKGQYKTLTLPSNFICNNGTSLGVDRAISILQRLVI
jgi:hypothetical protein